MSRTMKSVLSIVSIVLLLAVALVPQATFAAAPQPTGGAKQAAPGPMLVLSDIECVDGSVVAHFVLNKIPAGATVSDFTPMGDLTGGSVEGPRFVGKPQRVAHFYVTLEGDGSTVYDVQASVKVNGITVNLMNAGEYTVEPCGAPQEPDDGTLKICKELAEGTTVPAGTLFTFAVSGMENPVSVAPGTCAQMAVAEGEVTVTETGPEGYEVTAIDFLAGSGTPNLEEGSTTATIVANETTEIRFTNAAVLPATGTLKVCKALAEGTTVPAGTLFTFSVTGMENPVSVAPDTCAQLVVDEGTYTVAETGPSGYVVTDITFLAGSGTPDVAAGSTTAEVVANATTEVRFTNAVVTGYIQLCKETTGGLTGDFSFTSPALEGTQTINVAAGATQPVCGPVTEVDAGTVTVTEASGDGFMLTGVRTTGPGTDLMVDGMAATVTVPAGGADAPTQIIFANAPTTGYIQICKVTEGGLTGTFNFTSGSFEGTQSIAVDAGASQPVCGPLTQVTAGEVSVTEEAGAGFALTGVTTNGPGTNLTVNGQTATVTIPAGGAETQTQIIFTNAPPPVAYIQLCKETTGGLTGAFNFTSPAFDGTQTITIYEGATQPVCGPLTQVVAGEVVVTEQEGAGYTLGNVRSNGPGSVTYSGWAATASIPAGGAEQQTQIIFRNDPVAP